jgi:hypothetical protein
VVGGIKKGIVGRALIWGTLHKKKAQNSNLKMITKKTGD